MQYETNKQKLEKQIKNVNKIIPDTDGLIKKTDYNIKNIEMEKNT